MNPIDLHMHSCFSTDGQYTPEELVKMCKERGMTHMAIADHNSVKAVLALQGKELGIKLIPAIEIDCSYKGVDFHLLGYGIDAQSVAFEVIEEQAMSQEIKHSDRRLQFARETLGLQMEDEDIEAVKVMGVLTAEAIMEVCLKDERNKNHLVMQPYYEGGERSDNPMVNFYWDYYSQGKPGYTKIQWPELKDMVNTIHQKGGIAVLAHPGNNLKGKEELLEGIVQCGIDGLEVYSSYHKAEQIAFYEKKAKKYGLLMTCGSDFHGKTKPAIGLGQCDCSEEVQQKLMEQLKKM